MATHSVIDDAFAFEMLQSGSQGHWRSVWTIFLTRGDGQKQVGKYIQTIPSYKHETTN
jgi:hypothetical protein